MRIPNYKKHMMNSLKYVGVGLTVSTAFLTGGLIGVAVGAIGLEEG